MLNTVRTLKNAQRSRCVNISTTKNCKTKLKVLTIKFTGKKIQYQQNE